MAILMRGKYGQESTDLTMAWLIPGKSWICLHFAMPVDKHSPGEEIKHAGG
jgi:hypothetical protein